MMQLKNQINSAKRVFDYENVKLEPPLCTPNKFRPLKDWPQNAEIVFTNFHMKLTPDDSYKLKDLNFKINAGEKIGIMGDERYSIVQALYRFGFNEGSIEIDDINIDTLGLHDLRRAFTLIPPEPVLFSGTLRSNLDPFDEKTDDEIWEALEHVQMKNSVSMLDNGLTTKISSGCSAFIATERQLFCLARAILCLSRILIFEDSSKFSSDLHLE
jgi:ATP-binding cassette, subfamily C (CFTR/MRP), member 4